MMQKSRSFFLAFSLACVALALLVAGLLLSAKKETPPTEVLSGAEEQTAVLEVTAQYLSDMRTVKKNVETSGLAGEALLEDVRAQLLAVHVPKEYLQKHFALVISVQALDGASPTLREDILALFAPLSL